MKTLKAFTLIETLLALVIMTIAIGSATAWTIGTLQQGELLSTTESVVSLIRSQQTAARTNRNNSKHGLILSSSSYSIFEGESLASASASQTFSLGNDLQINTISLNGAGNEILFQQYSGETLNSGSFMITHLSSNRSFTISVSAIGLVDWQ